MSDLVAFLRARLDEDEAVAYAVADHRQRSGELTWSQVDAARQHGLIGDALGNVVTYDEGSPTEQQAAHIARHDPARVLRECEAKREIVRLHGRMSVQPGHPYFNDAHLTTDPMVLCRSCEPERMWRRERSWPCRTLRALALPYADHEDYREEWRP